MKQSKLFHLLFPFIVMAIPWVYLCMVWNNLPTQVPTHFDMSGRPNQFSSKSEFLVIIAILSGVGIGVYFILRNIHRIDPKRKYAETTSGVMAKIGSTVMVLLSALLTFLVYWSLHGKVEGLGIFFCGISLFLAYIGNLMHSIKPNYFAGFRLPWTLENEENWRKTHQLASKIWFIGGIALAITSLLVNSGTLIYIFISVVLVMAIVPGIYSYNLYRQSIKR